jgi:hypothetical protein
VKYLKIRNIKTNQSYDCIMEDDKVEAYLSRKEPLGHFGRTERWVRSKYEAYIDDSIDLPPVIETIYPEEEYSDEDVIDTKVELNILEEEVIYVLLKADYTIEISDYKEVPQSVSPMQIRLALNELGLRQTIEDAVDSGSQDLKDMWEFASEFKRDYPLIEELSVSLGFTKEQVDNIFRFASTK